MKPAGQTTNEAQIHPSAHVDASVRLGAGTIVGPGAVLEGDVRVGERCRIGSNANLRGPLAIGDDCEFGPLVCIGHDPQVKGNAGPFGRTEIGARNVFREYTQVHRSMTPDGATIIGDDGYFMVFAHVGHDSRVGDHVVMCNSANLGGHAQVMDRAFISAYASVHQYNRIGELTMVGGYSVIVRDVPPYCTAVGGRPTILKGLNTVGLRRADFDREARLALKTAYRILFRSDAPLQERLDVVDATSPEVANLVTFLRTAKRGVVGFGGSSGKEH